jgi:hypothetical protein
MPEVPPLEPGASGVLDRTDDRFALHEVRLHGKVIENDGDGGPRLVVEVEPLDESGRVTEFDGTLSLMLLAPHDGEKQHSLARWVFGPDDVQSAATESSQNGTIRFQLQLPNGTPIVDSTQIWVRLMPSHGTKRLAHADIDLRQAGTFASVSEWPSQPAMTEDGAVVAAVYNEGSSVSPPVELKPAQWEMYDGGWSIARPGEPANLPQSADAASWRATLEQPPEVVADGASARPKPRVSWPESKPILTKAADPRVEVRPAWSPDRPGNSSARSSRTATARPRWSATR